MMSGIRGKNTAPELVIRRGLHARGFRFRLHARHLKGSPDIILPKFRAVIFVHGCFWHGHDCHLFRIPSTRPEFWIGKIARNAARDAEALSTLNSAGWRSLVVWECALRGRSKLDPDLLMGEIAEWLRSNRRHRDLGGRRHE